MRTVYYGLTLLLICIYFVCAGQLYGLAGILAGFVFHFQTSMFQMSGEVNVGIYWVTHSLFIVACLLLCLAPKDSAPRVLAGAALGLSLISQLNGRGNIGTAILGLAGGAGQFCLLFYLRALAHYLERQDLADKMLGVMMAASLFAIACWSSALTLTWISSPDLAIPTSMIFLGIGLFAFLFGLFRYASAVAGLVNATDGY